MRKMNNAIIGSLLTVGFMGTVHAEPMKQQQNAKNELVSSGKTTNDYSKNIVTSEKTTPAIESNQISQVALLSELVAGLKIDSPLEKRYASSSL